MRSQVVLGSTPETEAVLDFLATHTRLLVVSDFDGTLAEFTDNPADATLDRFARVALRKLSELPNTDVAIVSGRALVDLSVRFRELETIRLIGSHGHEFDIGALVPVTPEQQSLLDRAEAIVESAVSAHPGARIELKPHGVVFHYRGAGAIPASAVKAVRQKLETLSEGVVRLGNMVVEYCIVHTSKGDALARLQEQLNPTVTVFIGDDLTDESAFERMSPPDISIKVGEGESSAYYRVLLHSDAIQFLMQLSEKRTAWMRASTVAPIDRHFFLSDLRTQALIDDTATVTWLCTPRLDGAPLFGSLVGGPGAGYFRISAPGPIRQEYVGNSLIAKSTFGSISVTDFLDCSSGRTYQRAGRSDLVRLIEGRGECEIEFAPKHNFGRVPTRLWGVENGLRIDCGQQRMVLVGKGCTWDISREGNHDVARCRLDLTAGAVALNLLMGTASTAQPLNVSSSSMLQGTLQFWESWLATLELPQSHRDLVSRSALVLRGLCYGPTGAIAAAATTSLPETIGGIRNWDYRYCWPRDACLSATALTRLGSPGSGMRLLDWILGIVLESEGEQFLAPLYTVTGRKVPDEAEVPDAIGYRGSRPVRIGNLAAEQLQLDALGPIAELMWSLAKSGANLTSEHLELSERLVGMIQARWHDADSGIWEVRGAQRHYVHSKIMCWYTVHCCTLVAEYLGVEKDDWKELAGEIRRQVETHGYSEKYQSYVAAYDLEDADAALLWVILSGFHPPDHPRSLGTLRFIMQWLVHGKSVYRYLFSDSLLGSEGEFIICRCWLIECLALTGDKTAARRMLEDLVSVVAPLSLLAEQWDWEAHVALGNYPQAYSHLGLVNAVCALEDAPKR